MDDIHFAVRQKDMIINDELSLISSQGMLGGVQACWWCECEPGDQYLDLLAREASASATLRKTKRPISISFNQCVLKLENMTHGRTSLVLAPAGNPSHELPCDWRV